tara:strand:- start:1117 stop:2406 length:1290 start_codon:yes stop_codon:yes gene_type:complete
MSDLEYAVLGGAIESVDVRLEVLEKLETKHFAQLGDVFDFVSERDQKGELVDFMIVMDRFADKTVDMMEAMVLDVDTAASYSKRLIEKYNEREVKRITAEGFNSVDSTMSINSDIEVLQDQLADLHVEDEKKMYTAKEALKEFLADLDERCNADGEFKGLRTGWRDVDNDLQGMEEGELTLFGGASGMGKTAVMVNIVGNIVSKQNKPVLVINTEMKHKVLMRRHVAEMGNIKLKSLKSGKEMVHDDWTGLTSAHNQIFVDSYVIANEIGSTPQQILTSIKRADKMIEGGLRGGLVAMDYIQNIRPVDEMNKRAEINRFCLDLVALSKKLGFHTLGLIQMSNDFIKRPCKRPIAGDIGECKQLEKHADNIGFIYRDSVYNEDTDMKGIAEIIWRKRREGEPKTNYLAEKLSVGRFEDLPESFNANQNDY